jgi:hypothetical protein
MRAPNTHSETLQRRVRLFLEGGVPYDDAVRRAYLERGECARHWLRPREAADHLGVGLGELQRLKRAGLPYHQMDSNNGLCLFLASEVDQWCRNREKVPRTPPQSVRRNRYRPRTPGGRGGFCEREVER